MTDINALIEVTQEDREAVAWLNEEAGFTLEAEKTRRGDHDHRRRVQAFARHRQAAEQRGADRAFEEAARIVERRAEQRFEEHGTREPDTNATYYSGQAGEIYESLDEEAEEIADAIRQRIGGQ